MPAWKHKSNWMPSYTPNNKELEAYLWCVRNNIRISPQGVAGKGGWKIAIHIGGDWKLSPVFNPDEIWIKYYEYCTYYYERNK